MCSIVLVCLPSADEYANSHNESGIIIDRTGRNSWRVLFTRLILGAHRFLPCQWQTNTITSNRTIWSVGWPKQNVSYYIGDHAQRTASYMPHCSNLKVRVEKLALQPRKLMRQANTKPDYKANKRNGRSRRKMNISNVRPEQCIPDRVNPYPYLDWTISTLFFVHILTAVDMTAAASWALQL